MNRGDLWAIIVGTFGIFLNQVAILCYVAFDRDVPAWLCVTAVNSGLLTTVIVLIVLFRQRRSVW